MLFPSIRVGVDTHPLCLCLYQDTQHHQKTDYKHKCNSWTVQKPLPDSDPPEGDTAGPQHTVGGVHDAPPTVVLWTNSASHWQVCLVLGTGLVLVLHTMHPNLCNKLHCSHLTTKENEGRKVMRCTRVWVVAMAACFLLLATTFSVVFLCQTETALHCCCTEYSNSVNSPCKH